jgi:quercetin 2,3-dioxygenase
MEPGARWTMPGVTAGSNRTIYFYSGSSLRVDGHDVPSYHLVELHADAEAVIENGRDESRLLLLQGRPIGEPVAQYGPFVMNSEAEIRQAFIDYQQTRFGGWPWESDFPVHPRDEGRFAQHADGRIERAG